MTKFAAQIDNLESQIQKLTHLVASLLKNQDPTLSIQEPHASSQAKKKNSHLRANLLQNHPMPIQSLQNPQCTPLKIVENQKGTRRSKIKKPCLHTFLE